MTTTQCDYVEAVETPIFPHGGYGEARSIQQVRCVYVSGHGGSHYCPNDSLDHSDEIRLRIKQDDLETAQQRITALEAALARAEVENNCVKSHAVESVEVDIRPHYRAGEHYEAWFCHGCRVLRLGKRLTPTSAGAARENNS